MFRLTRRLSASLLVLSFSSVHAATTSYYSQADFLSALGSAPVITHNFDSLTQGDIIADGDTLDGATFSYSLSGGAMIMVDDSFATTSNFNYLGTNDGSGAFVSGDAFTINFDQSMRAIGLYVLSDAEFFDDDFTITTSSGQSVGNLASANLLLSDGFTYASYVGLIEDDFTQGFNSITLSSIDAGFLFNVDDISVSAVPLPAAAWLFGSGLLGLAGISRRAKRNA